MSRLDDLFKAAEGNPNVDIEIVGQTNTTGLNSNSSDIEILDYVTLQLCHCLDTTKMAFKGGYILNKIITQEIPRATMDVDFSISIKEYYDNVKIVLNDIGSSLVSDGIIDSYEIKESVEERSSGGIKLHRESSSVKDLGVDVGLHDIDHGVVPINILGVEAQRFSVERMLSDKILAIYSRKRFRRPKDLYDFYIITNCFNVNMSELLNQVNIRNVIDWNASPMRTEVATQYKIAYDKMHVVNPLHQEELVNKPDFSIVLERVALFVQNWDSSLVWNCNERRFVRC